MRAARAILCCILAAGRASAEPTRYVDVDFSAYEYLDVVRTTDGSAWKGVIVEREAGGPIKLAMADGSIRAIQTGDVWRVDRLKNRDYVAAYSREGAQIEPAIGLVFPQGDIGSYNTSYAPDVRVTMEMRFGDYGLAVGALLRWDDWQLPASVDPNNAAWSAEAHAYGRVIVHYQRFAPYGGLSAGLDINYLHIGVGNSTKTALGFGMNLEGGFEYGVTPDRAVKLGLDYHPGTDTVVNGMPGSVSYWSLQGGILFRL